MRKFKALGCLVLVLVAGTLLSQSVPQLINYQGRLTDSAGTPLDGETVDLTFAFYGVESGGTAYLSVLQEDVLVTAGIYHVLIGSGTITPGTESTLAYVFQNHEDVWMGVKVDADSEMTPRSRISSVPYSLSINLDQLDEYLNQQDYDQDGYDKIVYGGTDCNDHNSAIHPGATDTCGDGIDSDCDGGEPNGCPCSVAEYCASGFCVDGYCCDNSGTGECRACNLSGTEGSCTFIPAGQDDPEECPYDPACPVDCDGAGACNYWSDGMVCSTECVFCAWAEYLCNGGWCDPGSVGGSGYCSPYDCADNTCYNYCDSDAECCTSEGYHCNTETHVCE